MKFRDSVTKCAFGDDWSEMGGKGSQALEKMNVPLAGNVVRCHLR